MTDASCTAINTAIIRETGRISQEIYDRIVPSSPWIAMTPRDDWPDQMGLVQTNMLFERMLPADDAEVWADVAVSDGNTNNCLPPTEIIKWGQTLRTWRLQKIAKETEEFCIEDLRSAFQLAKVLGNFTNGLRTVTRWVWENRNRNEWIALAGHKVTELGQANFNIDATTFDATTPPTSRLTWGTLERVYANLAREGVFGVGFNGRGAPVMALLTDENTERDLIRQDPDLRSDFRYSFMGTGTDNPLLSPFFATGYSYNGFKVMADLFPQRFEIVNNAYVRVQPYKTAAATTSGYKRDLNPAYVNATYQVSVVHVPEVYTQRIPAPISSPGGDFRFEPVNYMGDFRWVMDAPGSKCNPDGTIGRFRAVFASASEPVHPEYGYAIMHKNCPPLRNLHTSCYS